MTLVLGFAGAIAGIAAAFRHNVFLLVAGQLIGIAITISVAMAYNSSFLAAVIGFVTFSVAAQVSYFAVTVFMRQ